MLITLVCEKRLYSLRLPEKVTGQFWIQDDSMSSQESQILSIEADSKVNKWKIKSNQNVQLFEHKSNNGVDYVYLEENHIYKVSIKGNDPVRGFLFVEPFTDDRCSYQVYQAQEKMQLSIGSGNHNSIIYQNPYVSESHANLIYDAKCWMIYDTNSSNGIYVNQKKITDHCALKAGDLVFIMGFKLSVGTDFIAMNNPDQTVHISTSKLSARQNTYSAHLSHYEIKKTKYYYRSPYFIKNISKIKLKVDTPPVKEKEDRTPIVLTLAPALMMGVASLASGIATTVNALNNNSSLMNVMPTMIMSVSMLSGMVVFPFFMKNRDKKIKHIRETERVDKYLKYLDTMKFEIDKISREQKKIMEENHPYILNLLASPDFWERKLWSRTPKSQDFLSLRLGVGAIPAFIDLNFPEERFSIEEDVLRNELIKFSNEEQLLSDVPVCISLKKNRVVGVYGKYQERMNLLRNILLQIAVLYSYDEVKVIFLTDDEELYQARWIQHVWNQSGTVRYCASKDDEIRELNAEVQKILRQKDAKEGRTDTSHYIIISTSQRVSNQFLVLNEIMQSEKTEDFSVILFDELLKNLPKECDTICQLFDEKGLMSGDSNRLDGHTIFKQDIVSASLIWEILKKVSGYQLDLLRGGYILPKMLTFLDMYHTGKIDFLNIQKRWKENNPAISLQTPVGLDVNGEIMYLDLHERYHGPHGLIAGMTGSGKSEFIITYILSMAVNYHPNEVAFVLIDYKGGGLAGAFDNEKERLPHLAGTITNLDGTSVTRSILSIKSELKRRQAIFNKARVISNEGTMDIYKYQKMYRSGVVAEPMPHLFIISDEFAELKNQQPEFMEQLISTARIGRSLGVHLILATQRPSGVVNDQIWANARFKVCLKVQDKSDSMDMIKCPDAAELVDTGRFYLQVGYNEIFEMGQSAWCGASYIEKEDIIEEPDNTIELINMSGTVVEDIKINRENPGKQKGKQIVEILQYLSELAKEEKIQQRPLWLPEIPSIIMWNEIVNKYPVSRSKHIVANIGELDNPYNQSQELFSYDFMENGNLLVYGSAGSGKATFLTTLMYSLVHEYDTNKINLYIIDFGAETLQMYAEAPQVGDVLIAGDTEKISNLFTVIKREMNSRKKIFSRFGGSFTGYQENNREQELPVIIVIINNYSQLVEENEKLDELLISLTKECTKYGIYFVITESSTTGIKHRMIQNFGQILTLQLNDKSDYLSIIGSTGGVYPAKIKGRGLIKQDAVYEFQIAKVAKDENLVHCIHEECRLLKTNATNFAKQVPIIPEKINVHELVNEAEHLMLPYGIQYDDFSVMKHNFFELNKLLVVAKNQFNLVSFLQGLKEILKAKQEIQFQVIREDLKSIDELCNTISSASTASTGIDDKKQLFKIYVFPSIWKTKQAMTKEQEQVLITFVERNQSLNQIGLVFACDGMEYERLQVENWFKRLSQKELVWIGPGVTEQISIQLSNTREVNTYKNLDNSFGFLIQKNYAKLMKLVQGEMDE